MNTTPPPNNNTYEIQFPKQELTQQLTQEQVAISNALVELSTIFTGAQALAALEALAGSSEDIS